jgi:hypothetical protein
MFPPQSFDFVFFFLLKVECHRGTLFFFSSSYRQFLSEFVSEEREGRT